MQIGFPPQLLLTVCSESIIVDLLCASQALAIKYLSSIHFLTIVSCHSTSVAVLFHSAIHCIYPLRRPIASTVSVLLTRLDRGLVGLNLALAYSILIACYL